MSRKFKTLIRKLSILLRLPSIQWLDVFQNLNIATSFLIALLLPKE